MQMYKLFFEFLRYGYEFVAAFMHKVHYGAAYLGIVEVGFDTAQGVEHRCAALVDVTVCLGYVVDILFCKAVLAEHHGIDSEI